MLTGFLGSGKTTLLNHWVQQPEMSGMALLVNEFGKVGIYHHLVDQSTEQMALLDSGCLCCRTRGDVIAALKTLSDRSARCEIAPVTRIVIETTGLADPVPLIYTLMEDKFVKTRYLCDGIVTTISATHGLDQLQDYTETMRQVIAADRLLLTKCELVESKVLDQLQRRLAEINRQAPLTLVRRGQAPLDILAGNGLYGRSLHREVNFPRWLGSEAISPATGKAMNLQEITISDARLPAVGGVATPSRTGLSNLIPTMASTWGSGCTIG